MKFTLKHTDPESQARAGLIETDHGKIETPIFMPVGTVGSVKSVPQEALKDDIKAHIILGNTYHLFLRPGTDVLEKAGGLHKFINWDKPILTDSGGYQVYSLAHKRRLTEEGVTFSNHIDGGKHLFTPERVVDIQHSIGSDIMMVLDECPPYPCDRRYAEESMQLTHRWAQRCKVHHEKKQGKYGYTQKREYQPGLAAAGNGAAASPSASHGNPSTHAGNGSVVAAVSEPTATATTPSTAAESRSASGLCRIDDPDCEACQ